MTKITTNILNVVILPFSFFELQRTRTDSVSGFACCQPLRELKEISIIILLQIPIIFLYIYMFFQINIVYIPRHFSIPKYLFYLLLLSCVYNISFMSRLCLLTSFCSYARPAQPGPNRTRLCGPCIAAIAGD